MSADPRSSKHYKSCRYEIKSTQPGSQAYVTINRYLLAIINRAAMGRARFMVYPWFILLFCFFSFVGDQTQTSTRPNFEWRNLWCLLAKSCWNIKDNVTDIVFFTLGEINFLLVWSKRRIRREIINTLKKRYYVSHGMHRHCSFHFRYVTNKIIFTLQVYFCRSDGH